MLRRLARVARGLPLVTEDEAYRAYQAHVHTCGGCGSARTRDGGWGNGRCDVGLLLHNRWQAAAEAQRRGDQFAAQERRRETAARR